MPPTKHKPTVSSVEYAAVGRFREILANARPNDFMSPGVSHLCIAITGKGRLIGPAKDGSVRKQVMEGDVIENVVLASTPIEKRVYEAYPVNKRERTCLREKQRMEALRDILRKRLKELQKDLPSNKILLCHSF